MNVSLTPELERLVKRKVDVRQEAHRLRVPDLEPGQEWAGGYGSRHGDPKQNRV